MVFTRPLARITAVALIVLALLALLPDCASACSCIGFGGSQQEITKQALSDSAAVFSGEVADVEKQGSTATVTLRVSEMWKGSEQGTLQVSTPSQEPACGYPFEDGREYLVYAYGKEEPFKVDLCSETKPLSKAGASLQVLGDGQSSGGAPLPDTSGGVAGLGVVGLAGVAAATATLLLLKRLLKS
jgi:hypothetical protein